MHDDFLPSVARADFRDFVDEYQARVLYSILQIITTRNLTINEHSMKPQKVKFNGKSHGKWNAYVFQNGPCEHDLRCSRIYFAKVDGGILLHEYVESAH